MWCFTTHTNTPAAAVPELLRNQASQAGSFWMRRRPTLVGEVEADRSFQEASSGFTAGGPAGVCTCVCVRAQQLLSLCWKVISGWTMGGNCLQDPAKVYRGALLSVCVCSSSSPAYFLFRLSCVTHSPDTLNSPAGSPSKRWLHPRGMHELVALKHTLEGKHKHEFVRANKFSQLSLERRISGSRWFQNIYWNHSHSLSEATLLKNWCHQCLEN